jgi:hypothetical protein
MRTTSIRNERRSDNNIQSDCYGSQNDCIATFETECIKNDANWGHLFNRVTGELIASYTHKQGLVSK